MEFSRMKIGEIHDSPPEGVYVQGFFLEGAALDKKTGKLIKARSKVQYEQMPVIYNYAISSTAGKDAMQHLHLLKRPERFFRPWLHFTRSVLLQLR